MAMERMRKLLAAGPGYMDDASLLGLSTSEADPNGRMGHIPGFPIGTTFSSRKECANARVHGKTVAGIHGCKKGAYSIVLSGGYEDDTDEGDFILYTGTGGREDSFGGVSKNSPQTHDQSFKHPDNAALAENARTGRPVRVIRGPNGHSPYAPESGYRYDGLYKVERAYLDKGASGFMICRFELRKLPDQ
ncbi:SRA-YDG [Coprinopsis marcescibilis]|uniref:SRA-YDG n=1 Tax=Coprinopsis marcescibilis TaxID=230819 RepID=A0A5C3KVN3_COPMA|nr:SRA-YDG [Coprinopsis marcescibilis]